MTKAAKVVATRTVRIRPAIRDRADARVEVAAQAAAEARAATAHPDVIA